MICPNRGLRQKRRASILPLVAISLIALCGFVALAIDLGMIMVSKTQAQNAADSAAMAGARTLNGSSGGNVAQATLNAQSAGAANKVLGANVNTSDVSVRHGAYHYDTASLTFTPQYPPQAPDNYNCTEATVAHRSNSAFAAVFNIFFLNVSATATAAHRPRDVGIVLDYSGSMNNESDLWNNETYLGNVNNSSNNTDPVFPKWGYYSPTASPLAAMQCTSSDPRVGFCNVTQAVSGIPPLVNDFFQNARGASSGVPAFNPAPASVTSTNPGGDKPLNAKNSFNPAKNWQDITGSASVQFKGYDDPSANGTWYGYTQGPNYWGKTFYIWPPQPNNDSSGKPQDWRKKFFLLPGGSYPNFGGPVNNNLKLWTAAGAWNDPAGNYVINYAAILNWIKNTGPNPFPPKLRAGNVLYYDQIPNDVPASAYNHANLNNQITDPNQRFWKEYIDYTLGVWRDPLGNIQRPAHPACSIGDDFTAFSGTSGQFVSITGPDSADPGGRFYVAASDNPKRPRHRFWFGPMTMIQYLSDTGLFPGTVHDVSMYPAKLGITGALQDVSNNHPNDLVSLLMFARPHYTGEPMEVSDFNQAQFSLSKDYAGMINALWFPPNSSAADVRPWDPNGMQTPRAHGDYDANTATSYGFMLAYNQLSSSASLRAQALGGLGRKGAQRLIILETDGMANVATVENLANNGPNMSYYKIGPTDTVSIDGSNSPAQSAIDVAKRLCALETDNVNGPGFATPTKPVVLHCIAFGHVFEPTASGTEAANAMALMQQLSAIGGTGFPSSVTDTSSPYFYKMCVGNLQQRQDKIRQAFTTILDQGVSVVLVK
ncbi:MAG TPA: pilus assembly protein TadG-related protein [Gemmataceae bacterium]|jgi:hypothetical protein|nr:pilus assembly protein TadG-related protein [Gemmataceae bacterium]